MMKLIKILMIIFMTLPTFLFAHDRGRVDIDLNISKDASISDNFNVTTSPGVLATNADSYTCITMNSQTSCNNTQGHTPFYTSRVVSYPSTILIHYKNSTETQKPPKLMGNAVIYDNNHHEICEVNFFHIYIIESGSDHNLGQVDIRNLDESKKYQCVWLDGNGNPMTSQLAHCSKDHNDHSCKMTLKMINQS